MKIAILGAGGVGGYYGGTLARAGHVVTMLARGEQLTALKRRGIEIRTPDEKFLALVVATDDPESLPQADLAIVAVKCYSLDEILPAARAVAARGATILPLLNGVEAAERLVEGGVPRGQVLGGLTSVSVARVGPGVVERRSPFQKVVVGELDGGLSDRATSVAEAFRSAGAETSASPDIVVELWKKLAFIASMAAACGLARSPIGAVRNALHGRLLLERAVGEVCAVARARAIPVPSGQEEATLQFIGSLADAIKPSFLLDLESGGRTELDDLCGAVSRLGRLSGVATPIHDTATAALGVAR